jgi:hypothetical protein
MQGHVQIGSFPSLNQYEVVELPQQQVPLAYKQYSHYKNCFESQVFSQIKAFTLLDTLAINRLEAKNQNSIGRDSIFDQKNATHTNSINYFCRKLTQKS